jgi:lipopolysaccharide export system protein LptA
VTRAAAGLLVLAALGCATPARAQGLGILDKKSDAPIEIEADDGIEWRQNEKLYVARGNVKVVRGEITVYADTVTAFYREAAPAGGAAKPKEAQKDAKTSDSADKLFGGGGTEIWKLDAVGRMRIETGGDQAWADRGVYNVDLGVLTLTGQVRLTSPGRNTTAYGDEAVYDTNQALMVLTGRDLRFESPETKITARDSLEYYEQKNLAVARGNALAVQQDKRVRADVLTAHLNDNRRTAAAPAGSGKAPPPGKAQPQPKGPAGKPGAAPAGGPAPAGGGIERVDAFGNVLMSSDQSIARSEKGVYTVSTGMAVLTGGVKITRGENQLNGEMAEVNLNTGVSRILSGTPTAASPGGRVRALFAPAKAAQPAGAAEQMNETKRPAQPDDPARPRLPPKPVQ